MKFKKYSATDAHRTTQITGNTSHETPLKHLQTKTPASTLTFNRRIDRDEDSVVRVLRAYTRYKDGSMDEAKLTTEDECCLVVSAGIVGVTVLYPGEFFGWDDAAIFLSKVLEKPVFSFHIHDGDLWMYVLYENGEAVDQFNPMPDYWQELDDDERQTWKGNASEIACRIPGISPEQITRYLIQWGDDVFESEERKKAYPTDDFFYGDDWQLVDFMRKLGFDFPLDDHGTPRGVTFQFKYDSN